MVKSGATAAGVFVTKLAGALATPSAGPAGVLYVNGVANGAALRSLAAIPISGL